jgi:hypothetical protein
VVSNVYIHGSTNAADISNITDQTERYPVPGRAIGLLSHGYGFILNNFRWRDGHAEFLAWTHCDSDLGTALARCP